MSNGVGKLFKAFKLDGLWNTMSPVQRRNTTVFLVLGCVVVALYLILPDDSKKTETFDRSKLKQSVLSDVNTRTLGMDALSAKVKTVERENLEKDKKIELLVQEIEDIKRRRGEGKDVVIQLQELDSSVKLLKGIAKSQGWDIEDLKDSVTTDVVEPPKPVVADNKKETNIPPSPVSESSSAGAKTVPPPLPPNRNLFDPPPAAGEAGRHTLAPPSVEASNQKGQPAKLVIRSIASAAQEGVTKSGESARNYMPSGSILSGVLLSGLDAATGNKASKDPIPVVIRVQGDALLPNLYTSDIAECMAMLSGYGDLSSERAILRGETLSCITVDGEVIESQLKGYAVGEDGKAGIRGRLVSRTGQLLANTAMAGFASGVAEAFAGNPVPVIQTGNIGAKTQYQNNLSSDALNSGVSNGGSAALERLAEYYMDMAEEIFPVIEIDAMRTVDVVLTDGFKLVPKKIGVQTKS